MQTGSHSGGGMKVTVVCVGGVVLVVVSLGVTVTYGVVVLTVVDLVVVSQATHRATGQQASASQITRS